MHTEVATVRKDMGKMEGRLRGEMEAMEAGLLAQMREMEGRLLAAIEARPDYGDTTPEDLARALMKAPPPQDDPNEESLEPQPGPR